MTCLIAQIGRRWFINFQGYERNYSTNLFNKLRKIYKLKIQDDFVNANLKPLKIEQIF